MTWSSLGWPGGISLQVLLVEKRGVGGQAACSSRIENYPGFPTGISGDELTSKALKQAAHFGAEVVVTREVEEIKRTAEGYQMQMDGDCNLLADTVLLATGVQWKKLSVPGLKPLLGRGILYGAARTEAYTVIDKKVFIVGAGNSAGQAAMFFSSYAATVTILVRGDDIRNSMSQYLVEQLNSKANIHVETCTRLMSASGDTHLETICTESYGSIQQREADALFIMIGACTESTWMPKGLQRDPEGYVCTGSDVTPAVGMRKPLLMETSLEGVFCAGDIRHDSIKRVSSAMGEGSMAVSFIHRYRALQALREEALV
jgi:thioredoxin reductase (NADPH)